MPSMNRVDRFFWTGPMWLVIVWLLSLSGPVPAQTNQTDANQTSQTNQTDAANMPCDDWEARFPQHLTRATIPDTLTHILASQQGLGFITTFDEEKRMSFLQQPLQSSGQIIFIPTHGMYRQLTQPFAQEIVITEDAILQRDASGGTQTMALDKLPVPRAFAQAFLSLFSGTLDVLEAHFQVHFMQDEQGWQIGLKPINEAVSQRIVCVVLAGKQTLIVDAWMQEESGDVTHSHFHDPRTFPQTQWADYQAQFDWAR